MTEQASRDNLQVYASHADMLKAIIADYRADNERLREALQRLVNAWGLEEYEAAREQATEALKEPDDGGEQ